jgi:hypothetical protein
VAIGTGLVLAAAHIPADARRVPEAPPSAEVLAVAFVAGLKHIAGRSVQRVLDHIWRQQLEMSSMHFEGKRH